MIPAEGIAVDHGREDDVGCGEQSERDPQLAARSACAEEQQSCADRSEGHGMGKEPERNGEKNECVCQHGSPRTKFYSGRWRGWRQERAAESCKVWFLMRRLRSRPQTQKSEVRS